MAQLKKQEIYFNFEIENIIIIMMFLSLNRVVLL